jgi:thiopeptide-type bacteriocin biosynthesis protein
MRGGFVYRYLGASLFRAAAWPPALDLPARPADGPDADPTAQRSWISCVWAHPEVGEPVRAASPQLATRLDAIADGHDLAPRHVRRAAHALHRYVLRLQHRSTPFGLFAGVAPAAFADRTRLDWGTRHRARARADATWIRTVTEKLEAQPSVLARTLVTADATLHIRDDRLVLPYRPAIDAHTAPGEVSVRAIPLVRAAVRHTDRPIPFTDLVSVLVAQHPGVAPEPVAELVRGLIAAGLLHTSLQAPMTETDPVRRLLAHVEDATTGPDINPESAAMRAGLRAVHTLMLRHDRAPAARKEQLRAATVRAMTDLAPAVPQPLDVDLRLGVSVTLPLRVLREAERAADVLARLAARPEGSRSWVDYHFRFLDKYGPGAVVPLLELVDPNLGLGWPAGYRDSLLRSPAAGLDARDRQLLALAQHAAQEHLWEVELTADQIETLDQRRPGRTYRDLAHLDMRLQVHAATRQALDAGDFTVTVDGVVPSAGAAAGRFLDLLEPAERDQFCAAIGQAPTVVDGATRVQVSSPPLTVSTGNVTRVPALLPILAVGEAAPVGGLSVDRLGIGADAHHLYVIDLDSGKVIEPMLPSAVELANRTHPLARFLIEVPRARTAAFAPFEWGAADALPYLPRIRHGRAVLAAARWRATRQDLTGGVTAWRERNQVPALVEIGGDDRRLRLDLDQPADVDLLHDALAHTETLTIHEAADPKAFGWCDGQAHALTLALGTTQTPRTRPALSRRNPRPRTAQLPGAPGWATLKLYGHPDHANLILTHHVPQLQQPSWWFVRYRDPQPHLRLRFPVTSPAAFGRLAEQVADWIGHLRQLGLASQALWDGYQPETGRYGDGRALSAAEAVFVADSAATLAEVTFHDATGTPTESVTAASLLHLAAWLFGDAQHAARWLIQTISPAYAPHPTRDLLTNAVALADPDPACARLYRVPGGPELAQAWIARGDALAAYRTALGSGSSALAAPLPDVALSLLHMHHIRAIGPDETSESLCLRLARSAALSWTAREGAPR